MLKLLLTTTLFFVFLSVYSQNVSGVIYDVQSTAKNIQVKNTAQNISTYSNNQGEFSIKAQMGDSLVFHSLFYEPQTLVVNQRHLDETVVVELTKTINTLDEVSLTNDTGFKEFDSIAFNVNFKKQIKEGIKRNPDLYGPQKGNILELVSLIARLFKKKKMKFVEVPIVYATYKDFDKLFNTSEFFNKTLLEEELKIALEHRFLFFQYCEAQQIDSQLLSENNSLLLLDLLIKHSKAFNTFVKENERKK